MMVSQLQHDQLVRGVINTTVELLTSLTNISSNKCSLMENGKITLKKLTRCSLKKCLSIMTWHFLMQRSCLIHTNCI